MDVRSMLAYSDRLSRAWWEGLETIAPEALTHHVDFSFMTPLGILTHMANIEAAWMDVVEGADPKWARHSTKTWSQLAPVRAFAQETRARTHALVDDLDETAMQRMCGPVKGRFARDMLSINEILFTICTHEQIHRGEVLAALWSMDIEPPVSDYPAYLTPLD